MDPAVTGVVMKAGKLAEEAAEAASREAGGLLSRLLGPAADVVGQHWADQLREHNLRRLLMKTEARARKVEETGRAPGFANPRVASQVFESAQYSQQEVVAEYLSGVLASSRDESGEDDAGVPWSNVVARLSSGQLRLHYAIYASIRPVAIADPPEQVVALHHRTIVLPTDILLRVCGFKSLDEFSDALDGIMREGLIEAGYRYGPPTWVWEGLAQDKQCTFNHEHGVTVTLSIHGIRLFLWGTGAGKLPISSYLDPDVALEPVDAAQMPQLVTDTNWKSAFITDRPNGNESAHAG